MKKRLIYLMIAASIIGVGCSEDFLDPVRDTTELTTAEIAENAEFNPALIEGSLEGIYSYMVEPFAVTGAGGSHYDFGHKSIDIWSDILSGDMALTANGYGWYQNTANLVSTVDYTRAENRIVWTYLYKTVVTANEVIATLGGNDAQPTAQASRHMLGQAKALRAYAYFYLTQLFQRSYDPSQPILPFYNGVAEETVIGKAPASQIYGLIVDDLSDAIIFLDDFNRSFKHQINKTVAQGLLAYTYAAMGEYGQAKVLADAVIASGAPLTTTGQLAFPGAGSGFNDVNTASWIWGYDLTTEMGHQLVDWWGQIDYYTYSYAWAGDRKGIDSALFAAIPANDIRKSQFGTSGITNYMPINKFFHPGRTAGGQQAITTDLVYMRVEEFYLLSAEAAAKTGDDSSAKTTLKLLLENRLGGAANAATYVDPLSGQALKDAIYLQTRIEMWGEGKSYLAMKRNQATVTRGSNHLFRAGQSFSYASDELSFQIPRTEMDNNPNITDQN